MFNSLNGHHKRFLIIEQSMVPGIFNGAINGWFAWYLLNELPHIALWGQPSIGIDVIATLFLLSAITCLLVTPLVKRITRNRANLKTNQKRHRIPVLSLLPDGLWARSGIIGIGSVAIFAPIIIGGAALFGTMPMAVDSYICYKIFYTAILSATIGPVIAWSAVCDQNASE